MDWALFLVQGAAGLHLVQLPGMWVMSRQIIDVSSELRRLTPLASAVVRVITLAVVAILISVGLLIAFHPRDALGTALGRGLCLFLGAFWAARSAVQLWYYARLHWPRTHAGRAVHMAFVGVFTLQGVGYLLAWWLAAGA